MGNVSVSEIVEVIAILIIVFQFGKWLISFGNPFVTLRKRVDAHDEYLAKDKKAIAELSDTIKHTDDGLAVVGMALAELINHTVTGNDIDELKKHQKEITRFFFTDKSL